MTSSPLRPTSGKLIKEPSHGSVGFGFRCGSYPWISSFPVQKNRSRRLYQKCGALAQSSQFAVNVKAGRCLHIT
nr:MAG TPA: hypothetical protein [Bacteriophage sp.]